MHRIGCDRCAGPMTDVTSPEFARALENHRANHGVALSIVVPMHNERAVVEELEYRVIGAAMSALLRKVADAYELIIVDDCSTDGTSEEVSKMAIVNDRIVLVSLSGNQGQSRATRAGLRVARGEVVVVLDGDLQDPPETIEDLYRELLDRDVDVVYAIKRRRRDGLVMRVGAGFYHLLQFLFAKVRLPHGAASYVAMTQPIARAVAAIEGLPDVNIGILVAMNKPTLSTVRYVKDKRFSGPSRVGLTRLIDEAWMSLFITGALSRALVFGSLLFAIAMGWIVWFFAASGITLWPYAGAAVVCQWVLAVRLNNRTKAAHQVAKQVSDD